MDHASAQKWLDGYIAAWLSYDPDAIADLFTKDAAYRYHPGDEPIVGRDAIVASWLGDPTAPEASTPDEPGTYEASYSPVAVDGNVVVATGTTVYYRSPGGEVDRVYDNCFVLRFGGSGRCREFTEYCHQRV